MKSVAIKQFKVHELESGKLYDILDNKIPLIIIGVDFDMDFLTSIIDDTLKCRTHNLETLHRGLDLIIANQYTKL